MIFSLIIGVQSSIEEDQYERYNRMKWQRMNMKPQINQNLKQQLLDQSYSLQKHYISHKLNGWYYQDFTDVILLPRQKLTFRPDLTIPYIIKVNAALKRDIDLKYVDSQIYVPFLLHLQVDGKKRDCSNACVFYIENYQDPLIFHNELEVDYFISIVIDYKKKILSSENKLTEFDYQMGLLNRSRVNFQQHFHGYQQLAVKEGKVQAEMQRLKQQQLWMSWGQIGFVVLSLFVQLVYIRKISSNEII